MRSGDGREDWAGGGRGWRCVRCMRSADVLVSGMMVEAAGREVGGGIHAVSFNRPTARWCGEISMGVHLVLVMH